MSQEWSVTYKPWGDYISLDDFDSVSVKTKLITVIPGHRLSLQSHEHRMERWVVLVGTGLLVREDGEDPLFPGAIWKIAKGEKHRMVNTGETPLTVFEIQIGDRCDESDIIRYEDDYNR